MTQHSDIADDLGVWLAQMVKDAPDRHRAGELPQIEIELVQRAIVEINRLREQLSSRRTTQSITPEELNASNDE
jgi:hypothetical protein